VESDHLSFPREPYSDGYTLLITWKSGMPLALGASVLIYHFSFPHEELFISSLFYSDGYTMLGGLAFY
jgi:hypothetical protein